LLLATGKLVSVAMDAAAMLDKEGLPVTVVNARYIKPLDPRLESWARRHPAVVTMEDNVATGGFGSAVSEALAPLGIPVTVMAVPDTFIEQGGQAELLKRLGLDAAAIAARVRRVVGDLESTPNRAIQPGS
jgi:1-deoxy-D-xylulose-5-phosphate synthase